MSALNNFSSLDFLIQNITNSRTDDELHQAKKTISEIELFRSLSDAVTKLRHATTLASVLAELLNLANATPSCSASPTPDTDSTPHPSSSSCLRIGDAQWKDALATSMLRCSERLLDQVAVVRGAYARLPDGWRGHASGPFYLDKVARGGRIDVKEYERSTWLLNGLAEGVADCGFAETWERFEGAGGEDGGAARAKMEVARKRLRDRRKGLVESLARTVFGALE